MRRHATRHVSLFFFFNDTATTEIYTLSLHDALPISRREGPRAVRRHALHQSGVGSGARLLLHGERRAQRRGGGAGLRGVRAQPLSGVGFKDLHPRVRLPLRGPFRDEQAASPPVQTAGGGRRRPERRRGLTWVIHEYLLRQPILSPGAAVLAQSPRRTAESTPASPSLASSHGGLRAHLF